MSDTVSILDGNKFVVSDRRGDIDASPTDTFGLFLADTRFLSKWVLTINGQRPSVLSIDDQAYYQVQFFQALTTGSVYVNSHVSVARRRRVANGFHEDITISNHDQDAMDLEISIATGADFADLFEVKDKLDKKGTAYTTTAGNTLTLGYKRDSFVRETRITADKQAEIRKDGLVFRVHLPPRQEWTVGIDVAAIGTPAEAMEGKGNGSAATALSPATLDKDVEEWVSQAPRLVSTWRPLHRIYERSLVDLAALRFRSALAPGALPAAGLPWFMAVFGRDSLITSFQAMPFAPELAATTLQTLALFQGRLEDPFRDEEPGKILHELRLGELTAFEERPHSPYFGAADSTTLFLIVLEEYTRWTGDKALARGLEREARAAISWIDRFGDRDGDGYIEYDRRNKETGLENQCWKDSWDSIAFADGTLAPLPRATCELQGYAYDAKVRTARLAREVWNAPSWAAQLESEAAELKRRFNHDFWIPERSFFALALDGRKRKVDALTSNIGHLLWSGICDEDKAELCVRHLMSDALFSGWGIRTMATSERSYNPIGYHVGTVWPHDNSIIAWGLRCAGYRAEAARICRAMLEAAELFSGRLPEAFGGYPRSDTHYPVEYPTACSPQAWATATPLLMLRTLLGLDSDGEHLIIDPAIPEPLGRIELLDIPGCWGRMDAFGRARASD